MVAFRLRGRAADALDLDVGLAEKVSARTLDPYQAAEILLQKVARDEAALGEGDG